MPVDTAFKNLLLAALESPQVILYNTPAEAHHARFQAYNAFKVMKKEEDNFASVKEMLEFVVKKLPDGGATLAIQRKTTNLMQILGGQRLSPPPTTIPQFQPPSPQPQPTTPPPPPIDPAILSSLRTQVQKETPQELDASSPEGQRILRRLEINDWAETYCDNHPQVNFMQLMAAINQLPSSTSLQEAQRLLRDAGVIE